MSTGHHAWKLLLLPLMAPLTVVDPPVSLPEPSGTEAPDGGGFVVSGPEEVLDVLLIDDEPDLRASLEEAVREAGHRVTVANDGAEGLGQVTSKVFDVIICDVRLPKLDGLTLMRRVRQESPSHRGHPDDRLRRGGRRRRRPEGRRLRLPDQAVRDRRAAVPAEAHRPAPQPAARAGAGPGGAGRTAAGHHAGRALAVDAAGGGPGRGGVPERRPGAGHRRERHRQGAGRPHAARTQQPPRRTRSWRSTAGR